MATETLKVIRDYICAPESDQMAVLSTRINARSAALEALVEAVREWLAVSVQKQRAWSLGATFDGDLLDRTESELAHALAALDGLPPAWMDETQEIEPPECPTCGRKVRGESHTCEECYDAMYGQDETARVRAEGGDGTR